jgi:hypothetical protein
MRATKFSCTLLSYTFVIGLAAIGCGRVNAKADASLDQDAEVDATMAVCSANSTSCGPDGALYQCNAEGTSAIKVRDCQYGCSVDHCKACAPNSTFCSGDDLVMCSNDGEIVNPMTCAHGCQMDRCNTCDPGVAYCSGATAITCGADGQPASMMNCGTAGCAGGVCNACQPNTTSCQGDTLVVCNANGMVQSTTSCALGCATSPNAHCKALVPSYGVGLPSGNLSPLNVDQDGTLDLANCGANPASVAVTIGSATTTISGAQVSVMNQIGAAPICIVRFSTIAIAANTTLTITNSGGHVLSLQAQGDIDIAGLITFVNSATGPSPGHSTLGLGTNANGKMMAPGAGGGGAAFAGGAGGACIACGGSTVSGGMGGPAVTNTLARLNGGSVGGSVTSGLSRYGFGGRGGGGLQLVSLTRVNVTASGGIALNGEGGYGLSGNIFKNTQPDLPAGGGGSGGTLVVEAPTIQLSAGALAVANGGGGAGGCYTGPVLVHVNGQPGQLSSARAAGGDCPNTSSGDGGYEATGATSPPANGQNSDNGATYQAGGGGGGSPGFIILRGRTTASVMIDGAAIVSPPPSVGAVTAN